MNHETVRHGVGEYVDGQAHTNGVEIFALASRPEVVDSIQELARGRVGEWLTEFRDAIRALPEGRRQRYAEVRGLAQNPEVVTLEFPKRIEATKSGTEPLPQKRDP